jgi:phage gpG-like protein
MNQKYNTPDFEEIARGLLLDVSRHAASESVKFFKESFVRQGFTNTSFSPWPKSQTPFAGKRTMYKSGTLMQSIRVQECSIRRVMVEALDYGEMHNNGGYITVTKGMKAHFWKLYYYLTGRESTNRRTMKKISSKALFCKRMALMKVGAKIKIPKRQYIGHSETMMNQFDADFKARCEKIFKQHLNSTF